MRAAGLFSALVLAGCAGADRTPAYVTDEIARETPTIGKAFWIERGAISLCEQPEMPRNCEPISKGHIVVDGVEEGKRALADGRINISNGVFFRVTVDGSRTGYVLPAELRSHELDKDPSVVAAECKRRGEPRVGMTAAQVSATCWGKPEQVNRTETARGINEQYLYAKNRYIDFRNGIVTSIHLSSTGR